MKEKIKKKAILLRRKGYSFRQISEKLIISKSTASLWTSREKMSEAGVIKFNDFLKFSQLKAKRLLIEKKSAYFRQIDDKCSVLKKKNNFNSDTLKIFLALLYWCEGSKTDRSLTFTNSDPGIISLYIRILRKTFSVDNDKFRAVLYLHSYHDIEKMLDFWSNILAIDKKRISIYNKHHSGLRKKEGYNGCISLRYGDFRIFDELFLIIKRLIDLKI